MKLKTRLYRFYKIPSKLIFKWMISYLSVLILPILICSYYYAHTYQVIKEKTIVSQHLILENIKEQLDGTVNELNKISTHLQLNEYINSLSYKNSVTDSFYMDRYHLQDDLSLLMVTNSLIDQINIYFPKIEYIITSSSAYKMDLSDYLPATYLTADTWNQLYDDIDINTYHMLLTGNNQLIFVKSLVRNSKTKKPNSIIAIQLNKAMLQDFLEAQLLSSQFTALSLMNNNSVILSTDRGLTGQLDISALIKEENTPVKKPLVTLSGTRERNTKYIVDYSDLKISDIKLLSLTEKGIYNTTSYQLLTILFISLMICIVVGIIITYYYSFYNYRPINEIMGYLKEYPNISEETNEYNKIKKMITTSNTEIKKQRLLLKNNYIYKILTGDIQLSQVSSTIAEQFHLDFKTDQSYVVLLSYQPVDASEEFLSSGGSIASLDQFVFFVTQNILSELYEATFPDLHYCLINRETALIINVPDNIAHAEDLIIDKLNSFINFCIAHYQIHHYVGISKRCDNQALSEAYTQANNALEYLRLFKTGNLCRYSDTPTDSQLGYLNLKNSDYIINLVLSANQPVLEDYFKKIKQELVSTRLSMSDAKSCLYFFYNISMHLKVRFQQLYPYCNEITIDSIGNSFFDYSFSEAIQIVEKLFLQICQYIKEQKAVLVNKKTDEVARYIESNYFDINLNVSNISDHFNVTPSYLSKKFKEDYGISMIEYLYKLRIEHSLTLISNSSLRIADIAQMLGFQDSNAFIRIFKQYQGCTPGQYKNMKKE